MALCPAGYHSAASNQTTCSLCSRGKYGTPGLAAGARSSMSAACTVCPEGTYNDQQHQTSCTACPAGRFNYIDADQQSKYLLHNDITDCVVCPVER